MHSFKDLLMFFLMIDEIFLGFFAANNWHEDSLLLIHFSGMVQSHGYFIITAETITRIIPVIQILKSLDKNY